MTQTAMVGALPELRIAFAFVVEEGNLGSQLMRPNVFYTRDARITF